MAEQDFLDELADMEDADAGVTYPVTVSLSPFTKRVLDKLVNEQGYRTAEAAIDDALLRTQETDEWRQQVRAEIDRRIGQGSSDRDDSVDDATFMQQLKQRILAGRLSDGTLVRPSQTEGESKREAV